MGTNLRRAVLAGVVSFVAACGTSAPERAAPDEPGASAAEPAAAPPAVRDLEAPAAGATVARPTSTTPPADEGASATAAPSEEGDDDPDEVSEDEDEVLPDGYARNEDGLVLQRPELLVMDLIGEGTLEPTPAEAALSGLVDPISDSLLWGEVASIEVGRTTYVLVRAPGGLPEYAAAAASERIVDEARSALWLAEVVREATVESQSYQRRRAVRLVDLVLPANLANDATCDVPSSLRARDLDGDGEVEVTVIAALAPLFVGTSGDTCGVTAFLVGADLAVQARFVREYQLSRFDAGGEYEVGDDTSWLVRDVNGDGHDDLHVVEHFTLRDDFEGDWGGEESGTIPGHHVHRNERRETDCPWDAATDTWICAPVEGRALGQRLLLTPAALIAAPNAAIDAPPW